MKKRKSFPANQPELIFCYLCDRVILSFKSPEEERVFSKTGLCSRCQKQLKKELEKGAV